MAIPNTLTPILSGLRLEGSTFYTFSSSINDSALLFASDNIRMQFSKFVCLKLPNWQNQTVQRLFRPAADIGEPFLTDPNIAFVKSYLQNYTENLQQYAEAARTDNTYANTAEMSFWKSLRYVSDPEPDETPATGALQLTEDVTYVKPNGTTGQKYVERATTENEYEQLIQFVGDINMLNHVKTNGQEYLEIYCHIPRTAGRVTPMKFKNHDSMTFDSLLLPADGGPEYIVGRQSDYIDNLNNVKAIYDNVSTRVYDVSSDIENLCLDFTEFDQREVKYTSENFEFNAILLYYDIWDRTDESTRKRNLYGILILDRFATDGISFIPALKKYAPNDIQPGNSYGFKQNLKWSNYSNQVTSEITVGNELVGLDLYMDALARLTALTSEYDLMYQIVMKQQEEINKLKIAILQNA
jgi:hypothetical protein